MIPLLQIISVIVLWEFVKWLFLKFVGPGEDWEQ
jgi:hypothetical protein